MWVRNETWKRIRGEFGKSDMLRLCGAMDSEPSLLGIHFDVSQLPASLIDKLRSEVSRIEPGA
jgi:hypothetical protein